MVGHLQPVRAFMAMPDEGKKAQQLDIWMELLDGRVVLEGTASGGFRPGDMTTMAQSKLAKVKHVKGQLLFERHRPGTMTLQPETARIDFNKVIGPLFPFTHKRKLEVITEFHPWFSEEVGQESPWGRPILPPESFNQIMLGLVGGAPAPQWQHLPGDQWLDVEMGNRTPVGLFGGCEVFIHNGPIFVGEDYTCTRELLAAGETPRAEFRWIRTYLKEQTTGKLIAEMTLQEMYLKNSFEGYTELRAKSDARVSKL